MQDEEMDLATYQKKSAFLAQMAERLPSKQKVASSILAEGSRNRFDVHHRRQFVLFCPNVFRVCSRCSVM
ncbi:hypothetical protein G6F52_012587 [Rhizopus delemar]|nr:hypothetical protein G6F52_012587 [Rhizopus delemar]